ncbi:hypothetical protein BGZ46_010402 [Entomortierella lignicola]|nr:hypothetical protein BGZ46_010402 [Entomortierella lignicola]
MPAYITFPCEGKQPCVRGWNALETSIVHSPNQNYGILCGLVNNLTVIDCDLIKDKERETTPDKFMCGVEAWNILSAKFLGDKTKIPTVQTKNGGLHLYFRYNAALPSGIQCVSGAFFGCPEKTVKIDVLSDKKYVIGPESAGYTFIEGRDYFENPPELPDGIIEILTPVKKERIRSSKEIDTAENRKSEATSGPVSLQLLKSVVEAIPDSFADNYKDWLRVVWAIADTAAKNKYDALNIADEFSRRSAKYKDRGDVEKVYSQSNGSITFGTLVQMSEYNFGENSNAEDDLESVNTEVLISDLKVFEELGHATSVKRIVENQNAKVIPLGLDDGSNKDIWVYKNNLVLSGDNVFIGYARDKICVINEDLSVVHPEFGEGPSCCLLKDKDTIEFVYKGEKTGSIEHRIRVKNPWGPKDRYCIKFSNNKRVGGMISSKKAIDVLINTLASGSHQVLKDRYNINIYNNGRDVINNYGTSTNDDVKPPRSEFEFIEDLLNAHPDVVNFFKFCDSSKANNFDGLFVCSSVSGIWRREHNARVEKMLQSQIKKHVVELTEQEIRIVNTHSNIQQLRKMFVKEIYDDEFGDKVDGNLDIFATLNGVYDLNNRLFRRIIPQDYAMTNAGWKYDKESSAKHMDEVVDFFTKILPIEEERYIVLTFIASLLHGHRVDKKLLVLTDKRSGNNGKSTLLDLLRVFFGDYLESSTKFFCKAHFDKDRDSHDAGLEPLKGKRVVLADELKKSMKLDDALIKNIAGGHYVVGGRIIGTGNRFKYTWQAGVIMVFNELDCPTFDPTDTAFMERMVVCPMRSKFVVCDQDDEDSYTYKINPTIHEVFPSWRSSLLDYLIQYCSKSGLIGKSIPTAMKEWKDEIVTNNNDIGEWLIEQTELGNRDEFVSINDLRDKYMALAGYSNRMPSKEFNSAAKALFVSKGYKIKDSHNYFRDGLRKHARNVVFGLKMRLASPIS